MAAQPGGSILLNYGIQGAQQTGSAVLLSYDVQAQPGTTMLGRSTLAPWSRSRGSMVPLDSRHSATELTNHGRAAPWNAAKAEQNESSAHWNAIKRTDGDKAAPWPSFGITAKPDRMAGWRASARRDDDRESRWSVFGEMLNEDRFGVWRGAKPADHMRLTPWGGFLIKTYRPLPYPRPHGSQAHFFVIGGTPFSMVLPGTLASLDQPIHVQFDTAAYTPHFTGDPYRAFTAPNGNALQFLIDLNGPRELVVDALGNPVLSPAARDSGKLNPWGRGKRSDRDEVIKWIKYSRPLNPGWGVVVPGGPAEPTPGEPIIIPVRRYYIMVNEVLLARVDDNTPIVASQISISFDCDSWLPSFSATIPESARDAVMPSPNPVELYAHVNGTDFKFLVEKVTRNRQFANRTVTITGRGVACELSAPYAAAVQHTNASGMTAQQIIGSALEYTAYGQIWNINDWLVPTNVFSLYGTPADVALQVAEASGSVLQADWYDRTLRMLPRYPVKPWEWSSADPEYVIPAALTETESVEWYETPDYNVVYVSGTQQGVLGQVKIAGTAGDKPAAMVTHPLITQEIAARQRGISILSNTGRKAIMQISLPVLNELGIVDVCRFIEFSDGTNTRRGIVRANSISVSHPTVRQTLTIEAAA